MAKEGRLSERRKMELLEERELLKSQTDRKEVADWLWDFCPHAEHIMYCRHCIDKVYQTLAVGEMPKEDYD